MVTENPIVSDADADDAGENEDDSQPLAALQPLAQKNPRKQNCDGAVE